MFQICCNLRNLSESECVIYWPSTEHSIKRCTCVNKQKQVYVKQKYNQNTDGLSQFEFLFELEMGCQRSENHSKQMAWAFSDPRLSSPARMRKKCCYGQKNLGSICSSLSPSPIHLSHRRNITLSRIKCERYIFIKKCVRSFSEVRILSVDYVSALYLYNVCVLCRCIMSI